MSGWLAVLYGMHVHSLSHMTGYREVQKKESEEDVVNLDGPKSKRSKLEEETITVKEVLVACSVSMLR